MSTLGFGQGERCSVSRCFQFRQPDDMFIAQYIALAKDHRALEDVGQLAYVARPVIDLLGFVPQPNLRGLRNNLQFHLSYSF